MSDVYSELRKLEPGPTVPMTAHRDGLPTDVPVTLGDPIPLTERAIDQLNHRLSTRKGTTS